MGAEREVGRFADVRLELARREETERPGAGLDEGEGNLEPLVATVGGRDAR